MAIGLTPKQEAFAQAVVSGMTHADAYRSAYNAARMKPSTVQSKAYELLRNGEITARVEALRKPVVEKMQYGLEQAMLEAKEAFEVSRAKEQGGAMVAAVQLRAKLNGLLVDKKEVRTVTLDGAALEDLKALEADVVSILAARNAQLNGAAGTTH